MSQSVECKWPTCNQVEGPNMVQSKGMSREAPSKKRPAPIIAINNMFT